MADIGNAAGSLAEAIHVPPALGKLPLELCHSLLRLRVLVQKNLLKVLRGIVEAPDLPQLHVRHGAAFEALHAVGEVHVPLLNGRLSLPLGQQVSLEALWIVHRKRLEDGGQVRKLARTLVVGAAEGRLECKRALVGKVGFHVRGTCDQGLVDRLVGLVRLRRKLLQCRLGLALGHKLLGEAQAGGTQRAGGLGRGLAQLLHRPCTVLSQAAWASAALPLSLAMTCSPCMALRSISSQATRVWA
mmetsp:Transcript_46669/g.149021  ORF Transcript_46669/g.149021 Transcript_46669/m.149021 type:complete len:244 (-) Transcript_46669:303-1034(-)